MDLCRFQKACLSLESRFFPGSNSCLWHQHFFLARKHKKTDALKAVIAGSLVP